MHFFIDTADTNEIRNAFNIGILDGVTTNPTLISKTGKEFKKVILEICNIVNGPVSAEVISLKSEEMIQEGRMMAGWAPNIVVKIPMIEEGLKTIKFLSSEGIKTNATLIFTPLQALLAAKSGASYVSLFLGRLDDITNNGIQTLENIKIIFDNYDIKTQIIAASIRHPLHIIEAAKIGIDIATIPYSVIKNLIKHPLTEKGLKGFLSDWEKTPNKTI